MSDTITFTIDGVEVQAQPGQTIMEAADAAGVYIPRLCHIKGLIPYGSCRVCTVHGQRPAAGGLHPAGRRRAWSSRTTPRSCKRPAADIIEMLFVEGNHFCMFCEKSGNCELQALAYRFGIAAPQYPVPVPASANVDASHPDIFIDRNRCILCARCVRASRDLDGKGVFGFVGRGPRQAHRRQRRGGLAGHGRRRRPTRRWRSARSASILKKRVGYAVPDRQAAVRPQADRLGHRSAAAADSKCRRKPGPWQNRKSRPPRWPAASAATCRCWTSTSASSSSIELVDFDKSPDRRHQGVHRRAAPSA